MEGKGLRTPFGTLGLVLLILSLVLAHNQVEADNVCCQGPWGRACYTACSLTPVSPLCVVSCGCTTVSGNCPPGYPSSLSPLQISAGAIKEYCKLGCVSSGCDVAINTLKNSREQFVEEARERCNNACSELCAKTTIALATA